MPNYRVKWEIDVDAKNPVDAAVKALQTQKDWQSIAKVFDVTNSQDETVRVDLDKTMSLCDECGAEDADIGCPDGAQICQECFDKGLH